MSRDQKKAESRRRILDAARDVFFRDGFMRANLDEMAEKAGVAEGDVIIRLGERDVDSVASYMTALADLMVGQKVQVTVDKPGALRFARSVAVEIARERAADG